MKKYLSTVVFILLISETLFAQLDSFNLSNYKLPLIKRSQLDLNIDLNGMNNFSKHEIEDNSSYTQSILHLSNYTDLGYSSYKNNERLQSDQYYSIGLTPEFSKNITNDTTTDKDFYMSSNMNVMSNNRFYYKNQFFFESDIFFYGNIMKRNTDTESSDTHSEGNRTYIAIQLPLLVGKGRIEQVQDARLAIYILEELQKEGRISRVPDEEEILEFTALISKIKSERFFDSRIKKMYEIEQVDSFLQARDIATLPDARYFTTVYDNWNYASGPFRESGKRISTGIVPVFSYEISYDKIDDPYYGVFKQKDRNISCGMKFQVIYTSAKPVNLHWQRNWSLNASYGYQKRWENDLILDENDDLNIQDLEGRFNYDLGFYPNSRTDFTARFALEIARSRLKETSHSETTKIRYFDVTPLFSWAMHYYISPQVRLNVTYSSRYIYDIEDTKYDYQQEFMYNERNAFQQSLNAGFVYSFF